MFSIKDKAIELRKSGKSYRSIQQELHVPLSTLYTWLSPLSWSQEIGSELQKKSSERGAARLAQARKVRGFGLQFSYAKAKQDAEVEFKKLKKSPLFLSGLTQYWSMGDQTSPYYVRLSSADPKKMNMFRCFILEELGVAEEKVHYSLALSPSQSDADARQYWSTHAKIPIQGFNKSTFKRRRKNAVAINTSVCTAVVSSRYLKEKLLVWTRLLSDEFISDKSKKAL